ncbi:hypothetical protein Tco_0048840, partial [Tanacetum coccineum]
MRSFSSSGEDKGGEALKDISRIENMLSRFNIIPGITKFDLDIAGNHIVAAYEQNN